MLYLQYRRLGLLDHWGWDR